MRIVTPNANVKLYQRSRSHLPAMCWVEGMMSNSLAANRQCAANTRSISLRIAMLQTDKRQTPSFILWHQ